MGHRCSACECSVMAYLSVIGRRRSQPSLGAPNPLPLTGAEPGFHVAVATSLLLLGLGVLLLDRWGRALRWAAPCPAWHAHEETHGRKGCAYGDPR